MCYSTDPLFIFIACFAGKDEAVLIYLTVGTPEVLSYA
jgi:hypothetical protein